MKSYAKTTSGFRCSCTSRRPTEKAKSINAVLKFYHQTKNCRMNRVDAGSQDRFFEYFKRPDLKLLLTFFTFSASQDADPVKKFDNFSTEKSSSSD